MAHPYQIVRVCNAAHFGNAGLLLAACGPKIVSVNLEDGLIISQWPAEAETLAVSPAQRRSSAVICGLTEGSQP